MIEEQGIVIACDGRYAQVSAGRRKACGGCSQSEGCSTSLLASVFGSRDVTIRALNPVEARPGDRIVLGVPEQTLVGSASLLYGVPLIGFLVGAIAGTGLAVWLGWTSFSELMSMGAGLLGLLSGLAYVRARSERSGEDPGRQAVILRRQRDPGSALVSLR